MSKLGRGALWVLFPPAGAMSSYRAGRRKDTQRIVEAIQQAHPSGNGHAKPPEPDVDSALGGAVIVAAVIAVGLIYLLAKVSVALAILGATALLVLAIVGLVKLAEARGGS